MPPSVSTGVRGSGKTSHMHAEPEAWDNKMGNTYACCQSGQMFGHCEMIERGRTEPAELATVAPEGLGRVRPEAQTWACEMAKTFVGGGRRWLVGLARVVLALVLTWVLRRPEVRA